jgi:hypothetical protein
MFFVKTDSRPENLSCSYFRSELEDLPTEVERLWQIRTLLAYLYTTTGGEVGEPWLRLEHADMYVFWEDSRILRFEIWPEQTPEQLETPFNQRRGELGRQFPGYRGTLNFQSKFAVIPGSRIYPPLPDFWLNDPQDLARDLDTMPHRDENWALRRLLETDSAELTAPQTRAFTAMQWYARSCAMDIEEDQEILNLAIAFESLLGLEQAKPTRDRFAEAIHILVGPGDRLHRWAHQFYTARSNIVHDGSPKELMFLTPSKVRHGKLVHYGRMIFRAALTVTLGGYTLALDAGLADEFVPASERVQRIRHALRDRTRTNEECLNDAATHVRQLDELYSFEQDIVPTRLLVEVGVDLLRSYLDLDPSIPDELREIARTIADDPTIHEAQLQRFDALNMHISASLATSADYDRDSHEETVRLYAQFAGSTIHILRARKEGVEKQAEE